MSPVLPPIWAARGHKSASDALIKFRCLSDAERLCPICATTFDENNYRRFLALIPQPAHSPRCSGSSPVVDDDLHVASTLADAISRIDNSTAIPYIRHLHDTAYAFLQGQPRNCHKGLEANVRLLGCILQAKGTILLQSEITNELTSRVQELHSENAHLRRQLDEVKRLYDEEKECVREIQAHISDYMRTHPEIDLMMDEIIAFRSEINELRAAVAAIGGGDMSPQSTPSTPSLTDMEESEPPSATIPLMPSTPNETAMEASQLLASPLFIPALPEIGHGHEANCLDVDSDLDLERLGRICIASQQQV
ncbi:hypothetical protein NLJ89_g7448 [Agrocybe chaxingu]|uniref:Uncharacterized protein n=1 Tax=Agrocybe chaxingu TaxID=84603 RepID=A0A9W8JUK1_9AGAR|nr:hypothetical protein NLJ89_g7448 [Agrocybe chaxingu]